MPGIICEFVIAAASEGSSQSSSVQIRSSALSEQPVRQPSTQFEEDPYEDSGFDLAGVGWGRERGMSPARTTGIRDEEGEEDLYGDPMQGVEDEVPPTQQERYQGIFDS